MFKNKSGVLRLKTQRAISSALFPESFEMIYVMAGLLTYSVHRTPSRLFKTVALSLLMTFYRAYSNGFVQDFHLIPF